jgi:glycosyltransferase involved in cell wall biosynthesis
MQPTVAIVVKGYPRLSETFIAREMLALQQRGLQFVIVSLRRPYDTKIHDLNRRIEADVLYLPEYAKDAPRRVFRSFLKAARLSGFGRALGLWIRDLLRDPTPSRARRLAQAAVLAAELPAGIEHLHVHYLHTPASTARYAAAMLGLPFSLSAHAKDIWTTPAWEKRQKLRAARWTVTCTRANHDHLSTLSPEADVELLYHGIDADRFRPIGPRRWHDEISAAAPVEILSIARCVPKKGLDTLLAALALLPLGSSWSYTHVGGGELRGDLERQAEALGLDGRARWVGSMDQDEVIALLGRADIFCLPARIAPDGDRDGLPNVLLEAMSMELAVVTTPVSAIPEAVSDGLTALLVPPDDAPALARALGDLIVDPERRRRLGLAARASVLDRFASDGGIERLARRLGLSEVLPRAA